jgi:predicted AAA+ superfamily ATPase
MKTQKREVIDMIYSYISSGKAKETNYAKMSHELGLSEYSLQWYLKVMKKEGLIVSKRIYDVRGKVSGISLSIKE